MKKKLKKILKKLILGAKGDPRYKRTREIKRRVLTGPTCINTTRSEKAQWHNSKLPIQKEITPKPQLRAGLNLLKMDCF